MINKIILCLVREAYVESWAFNNIDSALEYQRTVCKNGVSFIVSVDTQSRETFKLITGEPQKEST